MKKAISPIITWCVKEQKNNLKRSGRILALLLAILLFSGAAFAVYAGDFYRADDYALEALESSEDITVTAYDKFIAFSPPDPVKGLIFYPGGKVEFTSYAPLMRECAREGIMCVLLKMPLNLAFFDVNAASGIPGEFPYIKEWYICGHSLGGVAASMYIQKHYEEFEGIIFLASYPAADLSKTDLKALSIYGSEDGVLNMKSYIKNSADLPRDTSEFVIDGGCHAYFGSYGPQRGDGEAKITKYKQTAVTAEKIIEFTGG